MVLINIYNFFKKWVAKGFLKKRFHLKYLKESSSKKYSFFYRIMECLEQIYTYMECIFKSYHIKTNFHFSRN